MGISRVFPIIIFGFFIFPFTSCQEHFTDISLENIGGERIDFKGIVPSHPVVFVFLFPDCPTSQKIMPDLLKIHDQYKNAVSFYGVVPNTFYSLDTIKTFVGDYGINFEVLLDPEFELTNYFQATTVPEIIFANNEGTLLYRGKLDNSFLDLGKRRLITTEFYLRDAMKAYRNGEPIKIKETIPIGCLIQLPRN